MLPWSLPAPRGTNQQGSHADLRCPNHERQNDQGKAGKPNFLDVVRRDMWQQRPCVSLTIPQPRVASSHLGQTQEVSQPLRQGSVCDSGLPEEGGMRKVGLPGSTLSKEPLQC